MQVSKQTIQPKIERDLHRGLCQLISDITSFEEAEDILHELLSETERVAIMKRLGIALFLDKNWSYDKIKKTLKVSSATIASVQERMGRPGLQTAIEKAKINEMADSWSEKLGGVFSIFRKKA